MEATETIKRNESYQRPEPELFKRKGKPGVWRARYRRYLADGTVERPFEELGDETEFPSATAVKKSDKYKSFVEQINNIRVVVTFNDLARMYTKEEITQRVPHGQITAKGHLRYLEDKWGEMRLDQLIRSSYDIRTWLQGDELKLRTTGQQASRQTRKHLRTLLVQMISYAVDRNYLPYNPFTGKALSVKKGGAPPVDRSEFYVSPEMFRFMLNDPRTPSHLKMMIVLAYTVGLRTSEFLGLRWEEIIFDGPEPKIRVMRSVDGRHVNDNAKTENSRAPVPMCERVAAALLKFREENPSIDGWVFGSLKKRKEGPVGPMWDDSLREDHLRPAFSRMAAKFKLAVVPHGTGFHAFRHAYNALIEQVSDGSEESIKQVQLVLMRQGDERTNDRYGKSAPPRRNRARMTQAAVTELAMGNAEVN